MTPEPAINPEYSESPLAEERETEAFAEFEKTLEKALAQKRSKRQEFLRQDKMLALAGAPTWTVALAEGLESEPVSAADLDELSEKRFLKIVEDFSEEDQTRGAVEFTMPELICAEVIQTHRAENSLDRVVEDLAMLGRRINDLAASVEVPDDTRRWSVLARYLNNPVLLADEFDGQVRSAKDSATIHRLLSTAQSMMPFLSNPIQNLSPAMEQAGRRLELLRRRDDDLAHLANFVLREAQKTALETLIRSDDDHWALHLVGAGGVGKTMFLRYITATFADERLAVARIDFDYLNPDYPRLDPGLLLLAIRADLQNYAGAENDRLFNEADEKLKKLRQELRTHTTADAMPAIDHPQFRKALDLYVDAILLLQRRPLLILDTCEELARTRPDGSVPETVRDTFRILEILHEKLPGMRVIFSGRRPLASRGDGWTCPSAEKLPPRLFLKLHEIRGFTHHEAREYLKKATVAEHLWDAIIFRSPELGRVVDAEWTDPAQAPSVEARCNPYDLKLLAEWATQNPPPTAESIRTSSMGTYVEQRIIRRLRHPELIKLLPVISLLGHINDRLLRELTDLGEREFEQLRLILRQQEWTNVRRIAAPGESEPLLIYTVEPELRKRLNDYGRTRRSEWAHLRDKALRFLERETVTCKLSSLDWTDFESAFNAFNDSGQSVRASRWWCLVERGLLRQPQPESAGRLLSGLCPIIGLRKAGVDKPKEPTVAERVRPSLAAAYAAALERTGQRSAMVSDLWEEVWKNWPSHPLRRLRVRLKFRAAAGRVKAAAGSLESLPEKIATFGLVLKEAKPRDLDADTLAAAISALEDLVDAVETSCLSEKSGAEALANSANQAALQLYDVVCAYSELPKRDDRRYDLLAMVSCQLARTEIFGNRLGFETFETALSYLERGEKKDNLYWQYIQTPQFLCERVVIEFLRSAYPSLGFERVRREIQRFFPGPFTGEKPWNGSADADRIEGLRIRLALCDAPADESMVTRLRLALLAGPTPGSTLAQRAMPPLCCVAAEELAGAGFVEEAIEHLQGLLAKSSAYEEETRQELERACLRIAHRFRLYEEMVIRPESLLHTARISDISLMRGLHVMSGSTPDSWRNSATLTLDFQTPMFKSTVQAQLRHIEWRTALPSELENIQGKLPVLVASLKDDPYLDLDRLECNLLLGERDATLPNQPLTEHSHPELTLTLELRRIALGPPGAVESILIKPLIQIGRRRAVEVALEEANFLALRLPGRAARLAVIAMNWCLEVEDSVGAIRAGLFAAMACGPGGEILEDVLPVLKREWPKVKMLPDDSALRLGSLNKPFSDGRLGPLIRRYLLVCSKPEERRRDAGFTARELLAESRRMAKFPEYQRWLDFLQPPEEHGPARQQTDWEFLTKFAIGASLFTLLTYLVALITPTGGWRDFFSKMTKEPDAKAVGFAAFLLIFSPFFLWRAPIIPMWCRKFFKLWSTFIKVASFFLITALLLVIVIVLLMLGADNVPQGEAAFTFLLATLGTAIGVLAIGAIGKSFFRSVRVRRILKQPLTIQVSPAVSNEFPGMRFEFPPLPKHFFSKGSKQQEDSPIRFLASSEAMEKSYLEFARSSVPELRPLLRRMRKFLGLRPVVLDIKSASIENHRAPWEAMILLNVLSRVRTLREGRFQIRRCIPSVHREPREGIPRQIQLRFWNIKGGLAETIGEAWKRAPNVILDSNPDESPTVGANILHLVGTVYEDSGGLRFRPVGAWSVIAGDPERGKVENSLRAEDINGTIGPVDLCILQGEPSATPTNLRHVERRHAALFRAFGARLVAAGVRGVLIVPPVERKLARKIVETIALSAKKSAGSLGRPFPILRAAEEIRDQIVGDARVVGTVRAADLKSPANIATALCDPNNQAAARLLQEFSAAGRRNLLRWEDLPRETLTGLLLEELNPILRKIDLLRAPEMTLILTRWQRIGLYLKWSGPARNRAILNRIFKDDLSDGVETAKSDACESALDVCVLCAEGWDERFMYTTDRERPAPASMAAERK